MRKFILIALLSFQTFIYCADTYLLEYFKGGVVLSRENYNGNFVRVNNKLTFTDSRKNVFTCMKSGSRIQFNSNTSNGTFSKVGHVVVFESGDQQIMFIKQGQDFIIQKGKNQLLASRAGNSYAVEAEVNEVLWIQLFGVMLSYNFY